MENYPARVNMLSEGRINENKFRVAWRRKVAEKFASLHIVEHQRVLKTPKPRDFYAQLLTHVDEETPYSVAEARRLWGR